jgi:hypothetical protein
LPVVYGSEPFLPSSAQAATIQHHKKQLAGSQTVCEHAFDLTLRYTPAASSASVAAAQVQVPSVVHNSRGVEGDRTEPSFDCYSMALASLETPVPLSSVKERSSEPHTGTGYCGWLTQKTGQKISSTYRR